MRELTKLFGRLIGVLIAKEILTLTDMDYILTGDIPKEEGEK